MESQQFESIDALNNAHYGKTVFVMGTSKHLELLDLSKLKGQVVIGTNQILEYFLPTYILMVDYGPLSDEETLPKLLAHPEVTLLLRGRLAEEARDLGFTGKIYQFEVNPKPHLYFRGPLQQVDNTAHYATEVAVRMRGTTIPGRIVLLGVDFFWPKEGDSHIFSDAKERGCRANFSKPLEYFPRTRVFLSKKGTELITCSPWEGPLTKILPRRNFDEVMKEETVSSENRS